MRITARGYKSSNRSKVCSAAADKPRDNVICHCMHAMSTPAEGQRRTASFADDALLAAAISPRAAAKTSLTVSEGSTRASTLVRTMSSNAEPALDHKLLPPASATALITAPAAFVCCGDRLVLEAFVCSFQCICVQCCGLSFPGPQQRLPQV